MGTGAVILTGASRGIGRAIAQRLHADGHELMLVARDAVRLADTAAALSGGAAVAIEAGDVSSWEDAERIVTAAQERFGAIYGLVNNAGVTADALLVRMQPSQWDRVMDVNLKGTYHFTKAVVPLMMRQKSGRIVNVTSVVGMTGNAGQANYAASKAGIIAFTKSIAREIGGRAVTVNAVAPGYIVTDMTAALTDQIKAEMLKRIPLKRFGEGQDVAGVVAFLLSPDAAYITGQTIVCDGGMAL